LFILTNTFPSPHRTSSFYQLSLYHGNYTFKSRIYNLLLGLSSSLGKSLLKSSKVVGTNLLSSETSNNVDESSVVLLSLVGSTVSLGLLLHLGNLRGLVLHLTGTS
jgi:hypothetical protein